MLDESSELAKHGWWRVRTILFGLGFLIVGFGLSGLTIVMPMYQVLEGERQVTVSFEGILVSVVLAILGFLVLLLGIFGEPATKEPGSPPPSVSMIEKAVILGSVAGGLGLIAYMWFFFHSHGYSLF
jgi:hypothetical protein